MRFTEKYCSTAAQLLPENKDKIVLSNDTFALCEVLNELSFMLSRMKNG